MTAALPENDAEAIVVLGDRIAPAIGAAWMRAVRAAQAAFDDSAFRVAYRASDAVKAQAIAMAAWTDFAGPILEEEYVPIVRDGFESAARATAQRIPEPPPEHRAVVFKRETGRKLNYSIADDTTLRMVMEFGADRVREIDAQQQEALRQSLAAMYRNGWSAAEAATDIRQHIGLTAFQAQSNVNFREKLIRQREKARTNKQPAKSIEEIDALTKAHSDRLLANRSLTIAITESKLATGRGQNDAWRQAVEKGWVDPDVAAVVWLTARDERVCPICGPMHRQTHSLSQVLGGVRVGDATGGGPAPIPQMGAPFTTGDGRQVSVPADTHPKCRCGRHLRPKGVRRLGPGDKAPPGKDTQYIKPSAPEIDIETAKATLEGARPIIERGRLADAEVGQALADLAAAAKSRDAEAIARLQVALEKAVSARNKVDPARQQVFALFRQVAAPSGFNPPLRLGGRRARRPVVEGWRPAVERGVETFGRMVHRDLFEEAMKDAGHVPEILLSPPTARETRGFFLAAGGEVRKGTLPLRFDRVQLRGPGAWGPIHELAHWLDQHVPAVRLASRSFIEDRAAGQKPKWLGEPYRQDEVGVDGGFFDAYVGRIYADGSNEAISMGFEMMFKDPLFLLETDPKHFELIFRIMRNTFR